MYTSSQYPPPGTGTLAAVIMGDEKIAKKFALSCCSKMMFQSVRTVVSRGFEESAVRFDLHSMD